MKVDLQTKKFIRGLNKRTAITSNILIGEGASRIVYKFKRTKVVKISKYSPNIQNKNEILFYKSSLKNPVLNKIHAYDPKYKWIIADRAKVLSYGEFCDRFGMSFNVFSRYIMDIIFCNKLPEKTKK